MAANDVVQSGSDTRRAVCACKDFLASDVMHFHCVHNLSGRIPNNFLPAPFRRGQSRNSFVAT